MNISDDSYKSMKHFHRQALKPVNLHIKRNKIRGAKCQCMANTLRGVKLTKLKAGQMYNLEYSVLMSLLASAVPMTVMLASLIKELN